MRALVTGGAGFIGSHLVGALLERGDEVVVLDDFSTGSRERLRELRSRHPERLTVHAGDVRRRSDCEHALRGCDAVLHQAAIVSVPSSVEHPAATLDVNLLGTARLLEAAASTSTRPRFVLASTCAVYGDATAGTAEDSVPGPASPYAVSKLAAEHQLGLAVRDGTVLGASLRYFNVYGPGQRVDGGYAAVIPAFVRAALRDARLPLHGDGRQTRDFCHVSDVVRANLAALDRASEAAGRSFNVGTGQPTAISELARRIGALFGRELRFERLAGRAGDIEHSVASTRRARDVLGWEATVSLDEGLRTLLPTPARDGRKRPPAAPSR